MARATESIRQRDVLWIITNSEEAEDCLSRLYKKYSSEYKIKFVCDKKFNLSQLINNAALKNRESDCNQAWCIYDVEKALMQENLEVLKKQAEYNDIGIAYYHTSFKELLCGILDARTFLPNIIVYNGQAESGFKCSREPLSINLNFDWKKSKSTLEFIDVLCLKGKKN